MVLDALQNYVQLASGLTKTTREKATATAKALLAQTGLEGVAADAGERVSKLADEILSTSRANRELLSSFVAAEIEQRVKRLGLARQDDLDALKAEIAALRAELSAAQAQPAPSGTARKTAPRSAASKSTAAKPGAKTTAAKKTTTKRAAAKKVAAEPAAAEPATTEPPTGEPGAAL